MPSLREIQEQFCGAIYDDDPALAPHVRVHDGLDGGERLAVYRRSVFGILTKALGEIYPVVGRLVGERFFKQMARAYIRDHPSANGDLHRYGGAFAVFIDTYHPAAELAYLSDVARLEWYYHVVFHAADRPPLSLEALGRVPPEQHPRLCFALHPAVRLLRSSFPVHRIWVANQIGHEAETVDLRSSSEARLLIARRASEVVVEPLAPAGFAFLQALASGSALEMACGEALDIDPAFEMGAFLFQQIQAGTLVDLDSSSQVS